MSEIVSFEVSAPATTANLGSGFDTIGAALDLSNTVTAHRADSTTVVVHGEGAGCLPHDSSNLVATSFARTFQAAQPGVEVPGMHFCCENRIPQAGGLGSSASATVAGAAIALALIHGAQPEVSELIDAAAAIEGHPDNVAPAVLGGIVLSYSTAAGYRSTGLHVDDSIRPVLCVPDYAVPTRAAREALPDRVPFRDAVFNASRAALLVHALEHEPTALLAATDDRLHQQYRRQLMPPSAACLDALRAAGIPACISGAGPVVIALTRDAAEIGAVHAVLATRRDVHWALHDAHFASLGARVRLHL